MNILLKNITAVIPDGPEDVVRETNICIEGNTIRSIGDIPGDFTPDKTIDGSDRLAIPGLINAHTHCYMTFMRGCGDDLPFMEWLNDRILPIEDEMTQEDAYWGTCLGLIEMIKSGTTCMNDMHVLIHASSKAVKEIGFRAFISRGIIGEGDDEAGAIRIAQTLEEKEAYKDCDRLKYLFAPHAPYSADEALQTIIAGKAREHGMGIHMHLSESVSEIEQIREKYGISPIALAQRAGIFEIHPFIAAHCVQITREDARIMAQNGVSVATNPSSNMKLGNGFAPVKMLMEEGVNVCLGTDGAASNNSQNMFREMGILALIHKGVAKDPLTVSAKEVFKMATINGAKALGMEKELGSLEVGKKADIAILDLNSVSLNPRSDVLSALSYSANGQEVDTVIIDGDIVMEGRKLTRVDEALVIKKNNEIAHRLGLI